MGIWMDVDTAIVEINRAAREKPTAQFREAALNILHGAVHFDTASWSSVTAAGLMPQDMELWRQHSGMIDAYLKVRASDIVSVCAKNQAGEPQLFNWFSSHDQRQSVPVFRAYCANSGYFNVLSVMVKSPSSNYTSLSLSRREPGRAFNEDESCIIKRIVPHLMNAWVTNHALNPKSHESDPEKYDATAMVCSSSGKLFGENSKFELILDEEFPDWDGIYLPQAVLTEINKRNMWRNSRLIVVSKPVADVHLVTIRRVGATLLTSRELEICRRAAYGLTQKQIAKELGISPGTVKNHLHNSYSKLNIGNKVSLSRILT